MIILIEVMNDQNEQLHILLVEDEEDFIYFISEFLPSTQFRLTSIKDGKSAFEFIMEESDPPDVILMDNHLPRTTGLEILKKLTETKTEYPIIFLTVDKNLDTVVEAMKAGAMDFMVKSMDAAIALPEKIYKVYDIFQALQQKKQLEEEKAHRDKELAELINISPVPMIVIDRNEKVEHVNKKFTEVFGYTKEDITTTEHWWNLAYPNQEYRNKTRSEWHRRVTRAIKESSEIIPLEAVVTCKSGELKEIEGRFAALENLNLVVLNDLSEQNKKSRALMESERRFREMLEKIKLISVILNKDGEIIFGNDYLLTLTGWKEQEVIGRPWVSLFIPEEEMEDEYFNRSLSTDLLEHHHESEIITKNGDRRIISWNSTFIRDHDNNTIGLTAIGEDITERKKMEEEIQKSLTEKEVLLREIHHRVKNNMQIISSLLNLQRVRISDNSIKDILTISINRIATMSLIHEKIYTSANLAEISSNEYIRDIAKYLAISYQINTEKIIFDLNLADIKMDTEKLIPLGLITNELVTNSIKHAFNTIQEGTITISMIEKGNTTVLEYSDSGNGLPDDFDISKITTLGINIIKSLVKQLQGELVIGTNNKTSFIITFPT